MKYSESVKYLVAVKRHRMPQQLEQEKCAKFGLRIKMILRLNLQTRTLLTDKDALWCARMCTTNSLQ